MYFGLVHVIAEHFGAETYHVQTDQLPQWLRARLRGEATVAPVQDSQEGLLHPAPQVFFRAGLIACREYMARFVEAESPSIAMSIRANWWPSLGPDFGPPRKLRFDEITEGEFGTPTFRTKTAEEVSPTQEALPIALGFLQPRATGEGARDAVKREVPDVSDAVDHRHRALRGDDPVLPEVSEDREVAANRLAAPVAVSLDPHRLLREALEAVVNKIACMGISWNNDEPLEEHPWIAGQVLARKNAADILRQHIPELLARLRGEATVRPEPPKCQNGNDCQNPAVREFCYAADPWIPYCAEHRPQYETAGDRPLRNKNAAR